MSRRARGTAAEAGLPDFGSRRRVPGLRREEVASLAGMGVDYYLAGISVDYYNARMDILAVNDLCAVLYGGILDHDVLPINLVRFVFLDDRSRDFFDNWEGVADDVVGALRTEVGRSPSDRALSDLVGELTTRSDEFSTRWARHDVRLHNTARKTLRNRLVGDIELTGEAMQLLADDLVVIAYSADRGSAAEEKLSFLASWAARHRPAIHAAQSAEDPDRA